MDLKSCKRKMANVALAGALAVTGAVGIVGAEACMPPGFVEDAHADNYLITHIWNNKRARNVVRTVELTDNGRKLVITARSKKHVPVENLGKSTTIRKSTFKISPKCKYYCAYKVIRKGGKSKIKFTERYPLSLVTASLDDASRKASKASSRKWSVAFQTNKSGKIVKLAVQSNG